MKNTMLKIINFIAQFFYDLWTQREWVHVLIFAYFLIKLGVNSWLGISDLVCLVLSFHNAMSNLIQSKIDENFVKNNKVSSKDDEI